MALIFSMCLGMTGCHTHTFEKGVCTECGEIDPDYKAPTTPPQEEVAGVYDANNLLLATFAQSGMNVSRDFDGKTNATDPSSPYYVLTNKYPTAKKVVLPDTVTRIGNFAFIDCNKLLVVIIPNGVKEIGKGAFYRCTNLLRAVLPNSVESVEDNAFRECTSLTTVQLSDNLSHIGEDVFVGCPKITYNEYDNCLYLGSANNPYYCFAYTKEINLTSPCTIHANTKHIMSEAFMACSGMEELTVPDGVQTIGARAFAESKMKKVTLG
ncbi:MAG: leucine-rich repeat domain-containing protein, partial [Clostridia bacterium]|nr:leucine-rich repeat domain-containing protein [Clostridia bacterium]